MPATATEEAAVLVIGGETSLHGASNARGVVLSLRPHRTDAVSADNDVDDNDARASTSTEAADSGGYRLTAVSTVECGFRFLTNISSIQFSQLVLMDTIQPTLLTKALATRLSLALGLVSRFACFVKHRALLANIVTRLERSSVTVA